VYIYATDRKEGYVLRKLQRGLTVIAAWCERWNIKINEDKTQANYISHRRGPVGIYLTLKGRNIPFVSYIKYLGVIFDSIVLWRQHIDWIATKVLRIFIGMYLLLKSERLSAQS
jgi:hypothetical protein